MSHEYAMSRVRDALEKSDGNHLKAQRLLLTWLEKDHTLLFGLVTPHMQGIISHAINHASQPPKKAMPKRIDLGATEKGEFGAAILGGMRAEDAVEFGDVTSRGNAKRVAASQKHVDAIKTIAKASIKTTGNKGKK